MYLEKFIVAPSKITKPEDTFTRKECDKFWKLSIPEQIMLFDSMVHYYQNMFEDKFVNLFVEYSKDPINYLTKCPDISDYRRMEVRVLNVDGTILNYLKNMNIDLKGYLVASENKVYNF